MRQDKNWNEYICGSEWVNNDVWTTQGIPGGKVNILGGHSKKLYMYMCPIPNGYRDRAISLSSCEIVDKKERLRTVSNTSI
jgi:hypothetical protein